MNSLSVGNQPLIANVGIVVRAKVNDFSKVDLTVHDLTICEDDFHEAMHENDSQTLKLLLDNSCPSTLEKCLPYLISCTVPTDSDTARDAFFELVMDHWKAPMPVHTHLLCWKRSPQTQPYLVQIFRKSITYPYYENPLQFFLAMAIHGCNENVLYVLLHFFHVSTQTLCPNPYSKAKESQARSPLHIALFEQHLPCIRVLLAHGADMTECFYPTALTVLPLVILRLVAHFNVTRPSSYTDIVRLLLFHGANITDALLVLQKIMVLFHDAEKLPIKNGSNKTEPITNWLPAYMRRLQEYDTVQQLLIKSGKLPWDLWIQIFMYTAETFDFTTVLGRTHATTTKCFTEV